MKVICAVLLVQLENIVSTSLLLQQVWLVDRVGDLVEKVR